MKWYGRAWLTAAVTLMIAAVTAGEVLYIADGSGGAKLNALAFAATDCGEVVISRSPAVQDAIAAYCSGRARMALIARSDLPADLRCTFLPYGSEAVIFTVSIEHPADSFSLAELREIWESARPVWDHSKMDIHRIGFHGFGAERRFFRPAREIARIVSPGTAEMYLSGVSLYCSKFGFPLPAGQKLVAVNGILPDTATIRSGNYPLAVNYILLLPSKLTEREKKLITQLQQANVFQVMLNSGLLPPEPGTAAESRK